MCKKGANGFGINSSAITVFDDDDFSVTQKNFFDWGPKFDVTGFDIEFYEYEENCREAWKENYYWVLFLFMKAKNESKKCFCIKLKQLT